MYKYQLKSFPKLINNVILSLYPGILMNRLQYASRLQFIIQILTTMAAYVLNFLNFRPVAVGDLLSLLKESYWQFKLY